MKPTLVAIAAAAAALPAEGSTIIADGEVNSVTVAADGTIYICQ